MKKTFKNLVAVFAFIMLMAPILALPAQAQPNLGLNYAQNFGLQTSSQEDPRDIAVDIVKYLMTFLGIIAVVVILIGGFKWMTAAGNEDQVSQAKKMIIAGAIGLVVILSAFAIVTFVINISNDMILE